MLKFTTTNGKQMTLDNAADVSYFKCFDCEQNVIIYWNTEKIMFSEVYVSAEEITALALMGLRHRRDTEDEGTRLHDDEDYVCQECIVREPCDGYPTPPDEEDYDKAYRKSVNIDTEDL
jgi:hypothetical protein